MTATATARRSARPLPVPPPPRPGSETPLRVGPTAAVNVRMMHLLERLAAAFEAQGVPLMVLKGAALNLTLYKNPNERPMADLDLLIRPVDLERTVGVLESVGCRRSQVLMREDFFPRFYYEVEFTCGTIFPVTIDLHVRPLRPVRFLKSLPDDALWSDAKPVAIGRSVVWVPSIEHMLIHLCAHSTVHGHAKKRWLEDIGRWVLKHQDRIDWERFLTSVDRWRLSGAVLDGICCTQRVLDQDLVPLWVIGRLCRMKNNWLDRLAIRQAPRDNTHPVAHVLVNLLCAPSWRFRLSYLWAVAVPDRHHMGSWYPHRHPGWLGVAHTLRWLGPITAHLPAVRSLRGKVQVQKTLDGRIGIIATADIKTGQTVIDRRRTRRRNDHGHWISALSRSDRPNVAWAGKRLVAIKPIRTGSLVVIDRYEALK